MDKKFFQAPIFCEVAQDVVKRAPFAHAVYYDRKAALFRHTELRLKERLLDFNWNSVGYARVEAYLAYRVRRIHMFFEFRQNC